MGSYVPALGGLSCLIFIPTFQGSDSLVQLGYIDVEIEQLQSQVQVHVQVHVPFQVQVRVHVRVQVQFLFHVQCKHVYT